MYNALILIILGLLCFTTFLIYFLFKERTKYTEQLLNEMKKRIEITDKYILALQELTSIKKDED